MERTGLTIVTGFDTGARDDVFDHLARTAATGERPRTHETHSSLIDHLRHTDAQRAVVEASDPFAIAHGVTSGCNPQYRLDGIVMAVDARAAAVRIASGANLAPTPRAEAQLLLADGIVFTDLDAVTAPTAKRLKRTALESNPRAVLADLGSPEHCAELLGLGASCPRAVIARLERARMVDALSMVELATFDISAPTSERHAWSWLTSLASGAAGLTLRFEAAIPLRTTDLLVAWGIGPTFHYVSIPKHKVSTGRVAIVGTSLDITALAATLKP